METPAEGGKYRFAMDMTALLICKTEDSNKKDKTKQVGGKQKEKKNYNSFSILTVMTQYISNKYIF